MLENGWAQLLSSTGAPVIILLIFFRWATQKLIPELQKERHEAIQAFQEEMAKEREMHKQAIDRIMAVHEKAIVVLREMHSVRQA